MIFFSLKFNIYKYENDSILLCLLRFQHSSIDGELFYFNKIKSLQSVHYFRMLFKYSEFLIAAVPQVLLKKIKEV